MLKLRAFRSFLTSEGLAAGFIIVVNTYSWFFPLYIFFEGILNSLVEDYATFSCVIGFVYLAAFISAFFGVYIVNKTGRRDEVLISWVLTGVLSSSLLTFLTWINSKVYFYLTSSFLGFSLGFGFPSCLAYLSEYNVENKGTIAGVTFLISGLGILIVGFITTLLSFIISIAFFSFWRLVGCILFLFKRPKDKKMLLGLDVPYISILKEKAFMLYFVPWFMYCMINYLEASLLRDFFGQEFHFFVLITEFAIGGFIALISGYLSDLIGRKILLIFGYVALGMGYAILGLFPYNILSWYIYVIIDGVSFGIFALTFFIILWGELALNRFKDKYYLVGELPYLVLGYFGIIIKPYIRFFPVVSAFSLASFFLFLAIIPLIFAPETLPEKIIKERELRTYIKKAKRIREKFTKG